MKACALAAIAFAFLVGGGMLSERGRSHLEQVGGSVTVFVGVLLTLGAVALSLMTALSDL